MSRGPARRGRESALAGILLLIAVAAGTWLDRQHGWFAPAFATATRLLDEPSTVARIRLPSQTAVARVLIPVLATLAALLLLATPWLRRGSFSPLPPGGGPGSKDDSSTPASPTRSSPIPDPSTIKGGPGGTPGRPQAAGGPGSASEIPITLPPDASLIPRPAIRDPLSARRNPLSIFWLLWLGLALRASFWIVGGNLPLVPGDSSHYIEVARSVYRGEGPVKHYVESYFLDYSRRGILDGRGVLDDWATPLWAYVLAAAYRLTGVVPGASMEATFAVAKGTSLLLNWITLPILYVFTRRWLGRRVAFVALGILAVLPVHALYAGMALRESLVGLTSLIALGAFVETWRARGRGAWAWAALAGLSGGLAILARNTGLALIGAAWLYAALGPGRRRLGPLFLSGALTAAVIAPWAWATYREYGEPFFTYTKYYPFNFSWTVHHYDRGNTRPDQFYRPENFPGIAEARLKSLAIVPAYTAMILGLPLAAAFVLRLRRSPASGGRQPPDAPRGAAHPITAQPPVGDPGASRIPPTPDIDRLALVAFLVFLLATLVQIADVTQVRQLARYYLPVYLFMLPTAAAGLLAWTDRNVRRRARPAIAFTLVALLWTGPGWAYDFTWYGKPFHARWPALAEAGAWIRAHPESVPPDARVLTWFPWELRVTSDRTTILFPRALEGGAYEVARLRDAIARYRPTHVLWGSFEPMPETDPESLGRYLESLRAELGLADSDLLHASPPGTPHPVRLYRLRGATR